MRCSEARLAANRANAQKSTGPRTQAGKEVSRLNAFEHGMAGKGDILGPGEDTAAIAALATEFERDYQAQGRSGRLLAHRAAVLSVRMDGLAQRQLAAVELNMTAARDQFDTDRRDWLDEEFQRFEAGGDEAAIALEMLEATPEGILRLLDAGEATFIDLRATDPALVQAATARAERWLRLKGATPAGPIIEQVRAELIRLDALFQTMDRQIEAIITDRNRAGLLARFDGTAEAGLAHRYEAAAERGMHRALRAIVTQNRERNRKANQVDDDFDQTDGDVVTAAHRLIARRPGPGPNQAHAHASVRHQSAPITPPPPPPPLPQQPDLALSATPWLENQEPPRSLTTMGSFRAGGGDRLTRLDQALFGDLDLESLSLSRLKDRSKLPLTASRR